MIQKVRVNKKIITFIALFTLFTFQTCNLYASQNKTFNITSSYNKKTLNVKTGDQITLTLDSTYWSLDSFNNARLKLIGDPVFSPIMAGPNAPDGCKLPGSGCGTVSWKIKVLKKGKAALRASRESCGEALKCTPEQGKFEVQLSIK